ncbi:MAG: zinc-dependent alcohol dehydrogenase [Thermacetogeniaceae bacterium]
MRAATIAGKKKLEIKEVEKPRSENGKVVIKITNVGICGSDLHLWENGDRLGLIMGHEFAGIVEDPGARRDLKPGDRVTALPVTNCGVCPSCMEGRIDECPSRLVGIYAPGAYAEYLAIRPDMVRKLPENVSELEGAMTEPTAVALHAIRLAGVRPGDKVLVTGGGIIGLLCAAWARIAGAGYIALTEPNPGRRENALKAGDADEVFDPSDQELAKKLEEASKGGFDVAFECAAVPAAIATAIQVLRKGGRLILLGVSYSPTSIPTLPVLLKELELKGSFGYLPSEFDLAIELMAKKTIATERFVSKMIGLEEIQEAFEALASGKGGEVKIVIRP